MLNIYQRVNAVMKEVDYIQKEGTAAFKDVRYKFVSHDAVTAKMHPLFTKHGIAVIPSVEEITQEGNRTGVKLRVNFINVDDPADGFGIYSYGYGIDTGDKGPGKAVSYAFKYALLKTFCLETGDDPDNDCGAVYEPKKCLEFDSMVNENVDRKQLDKYLSHCAEAMQVHVEDVKRSALTEINRFLLAFSLWNEKEKKK